MWRIFTKNRFRNCMMRSWCTFDFFKIIKYFFFVAICTSHIAEIWIKWIYFFYCFFFNSMCFSPCFYCDRSWGSRGRIDVHRRWRRRGGIVAQEQKAAGGVGQDGKGFLQLNTHHFAGKLPYKIKFEFEFVPTWTTTKARTESRDIFTPLHRWWSMVNTTLEK